MNTTQNRRFAVVDGAGNHATTGTPKLLSRRNWFRNALGGGAGLALGGLIDLKAVRAANENLKLSNIHELTTSCNFLWMRHGRGGARWQADLHGGRLRPHRESWIVVRQRHFHVRDPHFTAA